MKLANILYATLALALLISGCARSYVSHTGQIMDGNGNPIYPPLKYERVTKQD